MEGRDIILLTETHQSPERGLPRVEGYRWESAYRRSTRQGTARGFGGVAILFRQELQGRLHVVAQDLEARYIWFSLQLSQTRTVYIALCYSSPFGSSYALTVEASPKDSDTSRSPYLCLSEEIFHYSTLGEVFLMGDFNAHTQHRQCSIYDYHETKLLRTLEAEEVGAARISEDMSQDRGHYGDHLLELGTRHRLAIYNGMDQWPGSGALTCFPHGGHSRSSGTVVDYIMGSMEAASTITSLQYRPDLSEQTTLFWLSP